jgi:hypothetical protein
VISANSAYARGRISLKFLRRVIGGLLGIVLRGESLGRFESRGNSVRTGLGTAHFWGQLAIEFVHLGTALRRIGRQTSMSGKLLVFIHESNHPNAVEKVASGVILA